METRSLCFTLEHEEKSVAGIKNTYSAAPCVREVKWYGLGRKYENVEFSES